MAKQRLDFSLLSNPCSSLSPQSDNFSIFFPLNLLCTQQNPGLTLAVWLWVTVFPFILEITNKTPWI